MDYPEIVTGQVFKTQHQNLRIGWFLPILITLFFLYKKVLYKKNCKIRGPSQNEIVRVAPSRVDVEYTWMAVPITIV